MTSAVTSMPRDLAQRTISTEPAVERWQMWTREPTCSASRTSRAMIDSSATAGQPPSPSSAETIALVHLGALGQARLLRVLGDDAAEGLHVLQGAAHDHGVVDALAVVGEDGDAGGRLVHGAQLGELLALQADGDGADGLDVAVAVLLARAARPARRRRRCRRPGRCWPWRTRRCSRRSRPRGCRSGRSRSPRGPARAGGCAGRPGPAAATWPSASTTSAPSADSAPRCPTSAMASPSIRTSCGSPPSTFAPRIRILLMRLASPRYGRWVADGGFGAAEQQVQDGHPDGHAVGDLLDDGAAVGVGDLGGDLHAAVHRAGVHHDGVLGHPRHAVAVEAVAAGVLALGREEGGVHALALHAQHHHRVGLGQHAVEVVRDLARPGLDADRHQGGRGDEGDLGAEGVQQVDVGAGDPAVQDVADDGDAPAVEVLPRPASGRRGGGAW